MSMHVKQKTSKKNKRNRIKKEKCLEKHSHTAASTWIKTRRQISTWNWLNLQNKKVKTKRKGKKTKFNIKKGLFSIYPNLKYFNPEQHSLQKVWTEQAYKTGR
jgi:hypothetical protein